MSANQQREAGNAEAKEALDEPEDVRIPSFEPKEIEGFKLVAVDSRSAAIQWKPVVQLDGTESLDGESPTSAPEPAWSITYSLELQERQAQAGESGMARAGGKWSCCYKGSECYTQVKGLRPGRIYAFRVICQPMPPKVLNVKAEEFPPSGTILVSTPATAPSVPLAPGLASREKTSLTFKWPAPDETGGCQIEYYELAFAPLMGTAAAIPSLSPVHLEGQELHIIYRGHEARYKVSQLPPGTRFHAALQAVNKIGESGWSFVADHETKATVPGQPDEPYSMSKTANGAVIEWGAPPSNGAPVTEYQLQMDDGRHGDFSAVYTGPALRYKAERLQSGVVYRCRVVAFNEEGRSMPSKAANITTAAACPSVPVAPTVMGYNRTYVTVRWEPPEVDGGSPVTSYQVELQPKSKAALEGMPPEWVTVSRALATTCTLGGLRPGCIYRWSVRACNNAGCGKPCVPLDFKTAPDVPDAPGVPTASSRTSNSLLMKWAPPLHDGGSDIHQYRLEISEADTVDEALASETEGNSPAQFRTVKVLDTALQPSCSSLVEDLLPGKQYLFRTQATSKQGRSAYSPICLVNTKAAAPDRPTPPRLLCAPSSSSLSIGWSPSAPNGASITGYTLHLWPATAQSFPAAKAAADHSVPSENSQPSKSGDEPSALDGATAATAAPSSTSEESRSDSEKSKQKQRKQPQPPQLLVYSGSEQCYEARGLDPDTEYLCKLRCSNAAGSSDWSHAATFCTAAAAPGAPACVLAEGTSSSQMRVEWRAPTKDNGAAVTAYHVEVCSISGRQQGSWRRAYEGPDPSCLVGGLKSGRKHLLRVRAMNARGQGPWSSIAEGETWAGTPEAPDPPSFTSRAANSVRVQWQPVLNDNGAPIIRYRLEGAADGEPFQRHYSGTNFSHKAEGLSPGRSYSFRVLAINGVGEGPWSETTSVCTTRLPPLAPTSVAVAIDESDRTGILVSWECGKAEGTRSEAASHEVLATSKSDSSLRSSGTCSVRSQSLALAKLQPGVQYQVRVRSMGVEGGHSEWSEACTITMPGQRQSVPSMENLAAMTRSDSAASLKAPLSRRARSASLDPGGGSSQASKPSRRTATPAIQVVKARGKPVRVTAWTPVQRFYRRWRTYLLSVLGGVSIIVFCYFVVLLQQA